VALVFSCVCVKEPKCSLMSHAGRSTVRVPLAAIVVTCTYTGYSCRESPPSPPSLDGGGKKGEGGGRGKGTGKRNLSDTTFTLVVPRHPHHSPHPRATSLVILVWLPEKHNKKISECNYARFVWIIFLHLSAFKSTIQKNLGYARFGIKRFDHEFSYLFCIALSSECIVHT
jgi:hypothetical protein